MKDPKRIERIIPLLKEAWEKAPEWRLCQFISNLHGTGPQDIFHTGDDELEEGLKKFIESYARDEK